MDGYAMLDVCPVCHGTIDTELPDCSTCICEGQDEPPEWEA